MNTPITVLTSLVVGGAIGFLARDLFVDDKLSPTQSDGRESLGSDGLDSVKSLRAEIETLTAQNRDMQSALDRKLLAKAGADTTGEEGDAASKVPNPGGVSFESDEFHAVLAGIDWGLVGKNMKEMVPLMAKIAEAIAKGEQPDLAVAAEVQRLNADLIEAAKTISDGKVPGSGINGSFTHPVIVANQLSAALSAAGFALDGDQTATLDRVMKEFAAKDQNLRLAAEGAEFELENLAKESQLKHAFYTEAKGLLNKDQYGAIYNEATAGRAQLDMFDSSLMLAQFAQPLGANDAKGLAANVSRRYKSQLKLSAAAAQQLDKVMSEWSKSYPASYWDSKADGLEKSKLMKSSRMREALARHVELTRAILSRVDLSPEQRRNLIKSRNFLVPLPR